MSSCSPGPLSILDDSCLSTFRLKIQVCIRGIVIWILSLLFLALTRSESHPNHVTSFDHDYTAIFFLSLTHAFIRCLCLVYLSSCALALGIQSRYGRWPTRRIKFQLSPKTAARDNQSNATFWLYPGTRLHSDSILKISLLNIKLVPLE